MQRTLQYSPQLFCCRVECTLIILESNVKQLSINVNLLDIQAKESYHKTVQELTSLHFTLFFLQTKTSKIFLLHTKYCLTCAPYFMHTKPFFSDCKAHPHITDDECCFHSMIFYNLLSLVSSITYAVLNYFLMHPASKAC